MKGVRRNSEKEWQQRMYLLLSAIAYLQAIQHTASLAELARRCQVSRQTIANWLRRAERRGFVNLHNGAPRGVQLLARGKLTLEAKVYERSSKRMERQARGNPA